MKKIAFFSLAFICFLIYGCSVEKESASNPIENPEFKFRSESLDNLFRSAEISKTDVKRITKKNLNGKPSDGVEIDSTLVNIFELPNGTKTYTFAVKDYSYDNKLFNYIVKQSPSNEISHFIVEYSLDTDLDKIEPDNLSYHIVDKEIFEVNGDDSSIDLTSKHIILCIQLGYFTQVDKCKGDLHTPEKDPGCFNEDGTRATKEIFVVVAQSCGYGGESGGSSGSGSAGSGGSSGSGSTGSGGVSGGGGTGSGGSSNSGGGSEGSSANGGGTPRPSTNEPILTTPTITIGKAEAKLIYELSSSEKEWWNKRANAYNKSIGLSYLEANSSNAATLSTAISFLKQIINLAQSENSLEDVNKIFSFVLNAQIQNKIYHDIDEEFLNSVDQFIDADAAANPIQLQIEFSIQCAVMRSAHPDWSDIKIYWEASKEMIHLTLDLIGLVPVVGEVADLTNGVLYVVEGDGVNATLSVASAVPIIGWAPAGTKIGLKVVNIATDVNSKVKLVWQITDNVFTFGNRGQLRKVLGIVSPSIQAHHIIPWAKQGHEVVQRAARSGNAFHMNEALNGIPLNIGVHGGSHPAYDQRIMNRLSEIADFYGPNMTPQQAYNGLIDLINDVRIAVINNPNVPINQLIF